MLDLLGLVVFKSFCDLTEDHGSCQLPQLLREEVHSSAWPSINFDLVDNSIGLVSVTLEETSSSSTAALIRHVVFNDYFEL